MADVLEVSKAPVFASHSSCRALSNIPRNMTDEQIRAVAAKGGVVMVNFCTLFLDQKSVDAYLAARAAARAADRRSPRSGYKDDPEDARRGGPEGPRTVEYPDADWTKAVDHIERVIKIGGPQAAGLGTDFDGIDDPPAGLEDVSKLPKLTEELLRRGHSTRSSAACSARTSCGSGRGRRRRRSPCPPRTQPLPVLQAGLTVVCMIGRL